MIIIYISSRIPYSTFISHTTFRFLIPLSLSPHTHNSCFTLSSEQELLEGANFDDILLQPSISISSRRTKLSINVDHTPPGVALGWIEDHENVC